ncbi:unnamed protein product [Phaedon cochleariae]|uniref:Uncharacterized protein n=1 Tax=Phaedon cochleariae TaxID=80249 RepID=A0A9N9SCR9_PHACE|nr:unnamed protein product [Phaedon cochleariae]
MRTSVFPEGLESLLQKSSDGQIVLLNRNKLNNDHRQKLSKIIIGGLISLHGIDTQIGKQTKKVELRENLDPVKTDEQKTYLDFLKVATEPYAKILEAWEETFKIRRKEYMHVGLNKIFEDFPCLKLNSGIELIETDFNKKFPQKIDLIYNTLPKVIEAINKEVKEKKINVLEGVQCTDDILHGLLALPYLFAPITLKKSRKCGTWRPTRSEIVNSLFVYIQNFDEIELIYSRRKKKLEEFDITLQPFVVVTGEFRNLQYYIIIDNEIRYKLNSCIRALELVFKLFHSLDVEYPSESEHIWLFIGEMIFNMCPSKKNSCTASVVADIKYQLNVSVPSDG